MQYPIIDLITDAYLNNGWTGLDIPETITYEPIQLGSGDPSPTNVRPILPATTLNIGGNDVPIYGGTLDVTTGVLTVDRGFVDIGTLNWEGWEVSGSYIFNAPVVGKVELRTSTLICSQYKPDYTVHTWGDLENGEITGGGNNNVYIRDIRYSSVADFKTAMSGVQLVYELATPTTYQLTQTELENYIGIRDDIAHRLKLPLPHYFPHPVIDSLQRAAAGNQTAEDTEILRHYLTPLGIGGI